MAPIIETIQYLINLLNINKPDEWKYKEGLVWRPNVWLKETQLGLPRLSFDKYEVSFNIFCKQQTRAGNKNKK